jgi:polyisoprenoid-binding protein YceI
MILTFVAMLALQTGGSGRDSTVYLLSPASRFDVLVGTSGVFRFLGHEHLIRARAFTGRVVYHPDAPAASWLRITLVSDSLEVRTPPDTAELRQVTEVMRTQVLAVSRYPEITFASHAVTPIGGGFRVRGDLTIVGVTRAVTVDVAVTLGVDTLRATGHCSVRQTDFGIEPVRAGGGTVRVADRVTLEFAVVAVRELLPSP